MAKYTTTVVRMLDFGMEYQLKAQVVSDTDQRHSQGCSASTFEEVMSDGEVHGDCCSDA